MRILKVRLIAFITVFSMLTLVVAGCSAADKMTLVKTFERTMEMRSMESKSDITLRFDVSGLVEEDAAMLPEIIPDLENIQMHIHQKAWQNDERTLSDSQTDFWIQAGDTTLRSAMWLRSDIAGETPEIKQIIKLPQQVTEFLPEEFAGKQYMVMDHMEMEGMNGADVIDYDRLSEITNNLQPKLMNFLKDYAMKFDPGFTFIRQKGSRIQNGERVTVYELNLNDKSLKSLIKYSLTKVADNERAKNAIKELVAAVISVSGGIGAAEEMDNVFDELRDGTTSFVQDVNKISKALKDVRLLGDRGIKVDFTINEAGYIINQNGAIDLLMDMQAIEKAVRKVDNRQLDELTLPEVVIKMSMDFNTDIYNINEDIRIDYPVLNEENSFSFTELMNLMLPMPDFFDDDLDLGNVTLVVNNTWLDAHPFMLDELVLVPLSEVSEALGARVTQKDDIYTVTKNGKKLIFVENEFEATVNGEVRYMDFLAVMLMDKLYVPADFLADHLGADVSFDEENNMLHIKSR